jgi:hypothetical protein
LAVDLTGVRRYGGTVLATLALGTVSAVPAAAVPTPTGDPGGVVLARTVSAAFTHVPAVAYEQSGFAWMLSERGADPVFRWRWGGGPVAGMVPVREHAAVGLHNGLVSWWRDDLTPLPCAAPALCGTVAASAQVPAVIVVVAAGTFYAYGGHRHHSCFGRLGGSTPERLGEPTWSAFGEFQPPAGHGQLELLKSSYPWNLTGGMATEAASLSLHTHLPVREQTTIAAAGAIGSFSFSASYGYPAHATAPAINMCPS